MYLTLWPHATGFSQPSYLDVPVYVCVTVFADKTNRCYCKILPKPGFCLILCSSILPTPKCKCSNFSRNDYGTVFSVAENAIGENPETF